MGLGFTLICVILETLGLSEPRAYELGEEPRADRFCGAGPEGGAV